jgi:hypothetical protein
VFPSSVIPPTEATLPTGSIVATNQGAAGQSFFFSSGSPTGVSTGYFATASGAGDMLASVYDAAGGARQVAFGNDLIAETNRAQVADAALYPRSNPSNWITLAQVPAQTQQMYVAQAGTAQVAVVATTVTGAQSNLISTSLQPADTNGWTVSSHSGLATNAGSAGAGYYAMSNGAWTAFAPGSGGGSADAVTNGGARLTAGTDIGLSSTIISNGANITISYTGGGSTGGISAATATGIAYTVVGEWATTGTASKATTAVTVTGSQSNIIAAALTNADAFATASQGIAGTNAQARVAVLETNAVLKADTNGWTVSSHASLVTTNDARYKAALTNAWQNPSDATNWTWTKTATEVTLTGYTGPNAVVIPDMLDGLPVTGFGGALRGSTVITNVSGGENITTISNYAFSGCSALASVSLPNATTIGTAAFASCSALSSVSLPSAMTIGDSALYNRTNLASVILPNATTIGSSALSYCSALTSLSLPNVTTVGSYALYGCSSLTSVYFAQNAPAPDSNVYTDSPNVTNYVTDPTATGWGATWNDRPVVRMAVYSDSFVGNGAGITNITAAQVGAVATNDARYLAALTNGGATINGSPITNGAAFTTGGSGGGGISNIAVAGIYGTLTGSGSNVLSSVSLASLAGAGLVTNYAATIFETAETIANTSALTVTSYFGHAYSRTFTSTGTITHMFLGTNATAGNEIFMETTATGMPSRVWPSGYVFGYGGTISSNAPSPSPWSQMSVQKTPMGSIVWAVTGAVWQAGTP